MASNFLRDSISWRSNLTKRQCSRLRTHTRKGYNRTMGFFTSAADFAKSVDYGGWQYQIKVIFAILTMVMIAFAIYSYIKAHLLIQSHHRHAAGHGKHAEAHAGVHPA